MVLSVFTCMWVFISLSVREISHELQSLMKYLESNLCAIRTDLVLEVELFELCLIRGGARVVTL